MTMNLYSVFDKRAEEWSPLDTTKTDAVFARKFLQQIRGQYATDFVPYCVGTFDTETGAVQALSPRVVPISEIEELFANASKETKES